ncbi:MAG: type II toxin-antitoxin system HicA family toxin [Acidobacteria bacterium]|nr:type II toxin-antitoxin system HicA family toxin [Acidobacteriota bacterium]
MTKRNKLFAKLKNNPANADFREIEKLLLEEGFVLDRVSGSHHIFKRGGVTFVVPVHDRKVKTIYVKRVIEIIEGNRK